jgi:Fe-Mn family superoxide dismutase
METKIYKAQQFNLSGLEGISDKTLEMHFKLYDGYVKATNDLSARIAAILSDGKVDKEEMPAYSELTRRLGFEYNGMVLHEYYFANMKRQGGGEPSKGSPFREAVERSFPSFAIWKTDFTSVAKMRGVGWSIAYLDPSNGHVSNHWVELHQSGNVAGFVPLVVMDVWEHAYLLDYAPADRPKYIDAFMANVDWSAVDRRAQVTVPVTAAAR